MKKKVVGIMASITLAVGVFMGSAVMKEIIPITPDGVNPIVVAENDPPLPWSPLKVAYNKPSDPWSHIIVIG